MKLILDTANISKIKEYLDYLPVHGVTSNPSIIKKEGKIDFFSHMKEIRNLIGFDRTLHVQVIAKDYEGILKDAKEILKEIDDQVYIKIPVTKDGLKAIRQLKSEGVNITATAIYTEMQALLAVECGADFLAPYVNRITVLNGDPYQLIANVQEQIDLTGSTSNILAASFKQVHQVQDATYAGAAYVTVGCDVLDQFLAYPSIDKAVDDFAADWKETFGTDHI
ncbi:fructose-6-phosphate aldolase [Streptococcus cameli]